MNTKPFLYEHIDSANEEMHNDMACTATAIPRTEHYLIDLLRPFIQRFSYKTPLLRLLVGIGTQEACYFLQRAREISECCPD